MTRSDHDLMERLFKFSVDIIKYLRSVGSEIEFKVIKYQLIRSSTSAGANYEESQAASSKADFINKIRISLKEMRESNYWLRILKSVSDIESEQLNSLIQESKELKNILGAICKKASVNNK